MYEKFQEQERSGWDSRAARYGDSTALATTQAIPHLLAAVGARASASVLDVCCGPGYAAGAARALGMQVTGVDFSAAMVARAKDAFRGCRFEVGDAQYLSIADRAYDTVVSNFGVFHLADPAAATREAHRVLRPGGRYAMTQWCGPAESPFFRAVFGVLIETADLSLAPPAPDAFALSDREACSKALSAARFTDVGVAEIPLSLEVPEGDFVQFFRQFAVRGTIVLDAQPAETIQRTETALRNAVSRFRHDTGYRIPMPAFVVYGTRAA